jgi:hypothetical protein
MMGQVEGIQAITECKVTAVLAELLQYCALTLSGSRAYTLQERNFEGTLAELQVKLELVAREGRLQMQHALCKGLKYMVLVLWLPSGLV